MNVIYGFFDRELHIGECLVGCVCLCEGEHPHVPQMVSAVLLVMITTDTC